MTEVPDKQYYRTGNIYISDPDIYIYIYIYATIIDYPYVCPRINIAIRIDYRNYVDVMKIQDLIYFRINSVIKDELYIRTKLKTDY